MRLDEMPDERKAEPEPSVPARRAAVALAESIEDVRQERRVDPLTGIADFTVTRASAPLTRTVIVPPSGVNFVAFDNRFQITCRSRCASPVTHACGATSSRTCCCLAITAGVKESTVVRTISDDVHRLRAQRHAGR